MKIHSHPTNGLVTIEYAGDWYTGYGFGAAYKNMLETWMLQDRSK